MESGDPGTPNQKRPRLDSLYNGLPPPPPPPHAQPSRHPSHPTTAQASSPPPGRHYPPTHGLPAPSPAYPGPGPAPGHYPGPHPIASPSLPPSDIRAYSDPRNIPSPGQRTHGLPNTPVTLPARNITQDSISTYRPSIAPQSAPPSAPPSAPQPAPQSTPDPHQGPRSTSADAKLPPQNPMEHGAPQGWPLNPEHRHSGSIPNGTGYPVTQNHSPSHDQPFTPPLPTQHYGQPVNVYSTGPYMAQYASQAAHMRRKQVRATQACNHCRSRKQKCDEARPCQFCRENQFDCQYKDVPPPKQDRTMMQLQESVNSISENLKSFIERFEVWSRNVETRLPPFRPGELMTMVSNHPSPDHNYAVRGSMSEHGGSTMPAPVQGVRHQMHRFNSMNNGSPNVSHSHMSPIAAHASTPVKQELILPPPQQPATPADSVRTDHTHSAVESKIERKGLQGDHTTAAHQLLEEWPSLWSLCCEMDAIKNMKATGQQVSDYPLLLEQKRGLVRVWGVGEGGDLNDGTQGPVSPESNDSDVSSPRHFQEGVWGTGDHSSPSTMGAETPRDLHAQVGGLGPDGRLNLVTKVIFELHESYHRNIHSLHPFLNPSSLRKMVSEFSDKYSPDRKASNVMSPGSAIPNYLNLGMKRKRSSSSFGDPYSPARDKPIPSIERSLRNAIVLLVLALGKVCEYKDPLPAPTNDRGPVTFGAWGFTRDSPHSSNNSFSEDPENRQRNIDTMPGMAYFSYATDILGNQQGGNTVAHAQAMLLAALYLGQFARVLESWSWINNACRICSILVKSDMPKIERTPLLDNTLPKPQYSAKENYRLNLVKCVYWTCLTLETDILAELSSLPPSDISQYQATVSYPSGVFEKFPEDFSYDVSTTHDKTMWIYSSQIHLRVILNEAHNTLYGPNNRRQPQIFDAKDLQEVANTARVHADILLSWRRLLPPSLAWDDNDPPSSDINIARLRAKFYGGHYMILRPFLYLVVHDIQLPPPGPPIAWASQGNSPGDPTGTMSPWPRRTVMNVSPEQAGVLHVAHQCVESAIQSTIAFDRVGEEAGTAYVPYVDISKERLIVTNIFGTLHAQFGNMLVLAAVYKSVLRYYLPLDSKLTRENLSKLYKRTIRVLGDVQRNSPILMMDRDILLHIQRELNLD
ncbi:hypothetical protein K505DRAFT_368750 [Melanomma pulvis-pyrius CBS 109.77]|uniref:Zn(2)-C6 fungal-type domain-containing protein n=1 Tax=Melanomma pulvis-pyrius CBS 109.77 TaxID=1314802 RepID=A0A6A6WPI2_9PLEO|nr:hypothetical protein K505DRAFT_368750 [Melanomma pulvis-pyrius CBS 109.77]